MTEKVIPLLPPEVEAMSLEFTAWHIQVHMYQHKVFSDEGHDALDATIDALAFTLRRGTESRGSQPLHGIAANSANRVFTMEKSCMSVGLSSNNVFKRRRAIRARP